MERDNAKNRKRTRDQGGDEKKESHKGKKPEIISSMYEDEKGYNEFCNNVGGVFDFPWLKEGVVFKADEYLEQEDVFAQYSHLDEVAETFAANLDQSCVQNSVVSPALDRNFHDKKLDGDSLWQFQVDELEPVDCVWSSVVDQPLDNVGLNKA